MIKNRLPLILLLNMMGLILFFSWYLPANHGFWYPLDAAIFHFFNQWVAKSHSYALLLALINHRVFDACSLLAMGALMLSFWLKGQHAERRRIVMIGLVMLLSALIINQLAQHLMPVDRSSPSLAFSDIVRVRDVVSLPTKDASKDSFPGDHGMMLLVFAAFMWRYFGSRAFIIALVIFIVFAFPRVMIGAHWFTDIIVGSLSAILIGAPWILLTSLSDKLIAWFNHIIPLRIGNFSL
ncbi:phosphatase PAP2 family protein [Enterobacteriaceae bacterium ESL0689]|nr:phosphatase PAP2 family protein [Enterobacteriaceae bacterium ESL0689]